jgi:hypothetical protein
VRSYYIRPVAGACRISYRSVYGAYTFSSERNFQRSTEKIDIYFNWGEKKEKKEGERHQKAKSKKQKAKRKKKSPHFL